MMPQHGSWPPHQIESLPWRQHTRGGTRADRTLASIDASIPPFIAELDHLPSLKTLGETESALIAIAQVDTDAEGHSAALSRFMIRSESVASSKIERIDASARDYARALSGSRSNASATSMVAASSAMHQLISAVGERGVIAREMLLNAHRALMVDDPLEARYAGRIRDMQNWVGGSDHSPRAALYIPPAPGRVWDLLDDLIEYLNRDDVPVMVQAAIAHAQFESIHAFTDGNGRIGRALVGASLRRRGVTRNAVIPTASGLLARRDDYFDTLTAYRRGDPEPVIALFATSARVAAVEARVSTTRIKALPQLWRAEFKPRAGSAAARILDAFYDHPVMSAAEVEAASGAERVPTFRAVNALEEAGILEEVTGRKRDRVWAAAELLAELDDLDARIQQGMR